MKRLIFAISVLMMVGVSTAAANTRQFYDNDLTRGSRISSFSTEYNEKNKNRTANIILASEAINDVVLFPGEVFSFNDTIGHTTRRNGYKQATVFYKNEKQKSYGGGVCQVSTTLFNAAEMAGMEIVERHSHSLDVTYIEEGRDATTSHRGDLDFRFRNTHEYPVQIRVENEDGQLTVEILVF